MKLVKFDLEFEANGTKIIYPAEGISAFKNTNIIDDEGTPKVAGEYYGSSESLDEWIPPVE